MYDDKAKSLGDFKDTHQQTCFGKLMSGSCNKPNCSYGHGEGVILRTMQQLNRLHPQGDAAPRVGRPAPAPRRCVTAIHEADRVKEYKKKDGKDPPPKRSNPHILSREKVEPLINEALYVALQSSLNNAILPELLKEDLLKYTFHGGHIDLPKKEPLKFTAIIDTGALTASYMSKPFHMGNRFSSRVPGVSDPHPPFPV